MHIQQINASYQADEDRILLRVVVNTGEEFRFWLTRACMREFVPQATAWVSADKNSAPTTTDALKQSFNREAAAADADFSVSLTPGTSFPLGETPLLVKHMHLESGERDLVRLHLKMTDTRIISLQLEESALAAVQRLLREVSASAHWDLAQMSPQQGNEKLNPQQLH